MSKIIKFTAIFLALTLLFLPVLGQMNSNDNSQGKSKNDSNMMKSGNNYNNSMRENAREMYDNGSRMRNARGMMGMGFYNSKNSNYGSYVTFSVDNTTGNVLNFAISGVAIFNSINIQGFDFKSSTTEGAQTKIASMDGSTGIQIHDNPAAVFDIKTGNSTTLNFNLASGASATKQDNTITITAGNITAYIVSEKASSINIAGNQVSIDTSGNTIFRASPTNMPNDKMEGRFMEQVKTKKAGAEVSVGKSDKYSIVNYSDMNVSMKSIAKDRMRMTVNSSDPSGKFILMNIDNSSLIWNEGQKITLYLDNKTLREVGTEQELYNATESSFWLNKTGNNKMQALVYISKFSPDRYCCSPGH
ncbi:MAG: hypothetical protein O8C61_05275 [Candidatus Methanoperedens sp.]|nr:hypothetical protein [Candidatus Methanoperedens sp.]